MFVEDLKNDFYNLLIGKRILIIVNYDIDAICGIKILKTLFSNDNMLYSLIPIMGISGLKRAFNDNKEDIKYVILINCGGCIDVIDLLQPNDDILFFVCDSHRPYDVCNIYSDNQVRILGKPDSEDNIPSFESIFCESDDEDVDADDENFEDESDEEDNADNDSGKENGHPKKSKKLSRTEKIEQNIIKKRNKRLWEDNRNKLMFNYMQYSYYGRSTSIILYELSWLLTKDTLDLLWCGILGLTEQLILNKINNTTYILECNNIQSHINRLLNKNLDIDNVQKTVIKINYEKDLYLSLYRHWSIYESIKYSMYTACKLRLWTLDGEKKLNELLVDIGLPIVQSKQLFTSMDLILRKEFLTMIEKLSEKYNIPDIIYGSFTLSYGYKYRYTATDYIYSMLSILEKINNERTTESCFLETMDTLTRSNNHLLDHGIVWSKEFHKSIFKQVQQCLAMHQIYSAGPFLYYILNEENIYFSYPYGLYLLGKFILNGHVQVSRNRRAKELPLIISCPIDLDRGLNLLIGIQPITEVTNKNLFGKAFEHAASKTSIVISQDFFDTSIIQIKQNDLTRFLDSLTVLLS